MSLKPLLAQHIERIPAELQGAVTLFTEQLAEKLTPADWLVFEHEAFAQSVLKVCCCSHFVTESWLRTPALLTDLVASGALFSGVHRASYLPALQAETFDGEAVLAKRLRDFRRREMVRIAWRDLAGWAELDETLRDLTALAEACIQVALDFFYQQACQRWGTPTLASGEPFNMVVLGMGKLGAWELNYSSDIDLIFAYAEDGLLQQKKEISHGEFFTRIGRSLVKTLDEITVDGFVFRTDIRLRPFGDSGPLIMNFEGMENYYLTQAREWERYAMIKARQVAGDVETGKQLAAMIKPFVYRRYLDYGAFEELRSLKFQITQELKRKDRMDNIKLGPGGIREVEFIGQAFQLIRGGQESALQQREIQVILDVLETLQLMTAEDVATLKRAYRFLRRVENHIQEYQDKQTHDLPQHDLAQKALAYSLDFADWETFKYALDDIRAGVHAIFDQVFSLSEQDHQQQATRLVWVGADEEFALQALQDVGFADPQAIFAALGHFKTAYSIKRMTRKGAGVLDRLMPLLIERVPMVGNPDVTLSRILALFEAVAGRNVYLSLLAENPDALTQLIRLASASQWICDYLALYPILFDELLDPASLFEPLKKSDLSRDLARELGKIDASDSEQLMIALRQFKHQNVLRVAAADIMGAIPVMVVSDYLTWIAEAILEQVLERAWCMLTDKHGCPPGASTDKASQFGIVGFGKFGGIELGYASDLDLVFLFECADADAMTEGDKPINSGQFFLRLGQKIRHILDTKMLSGVLYEVDLRLRPNGDSGVLVTHIQYYEAYLREQAWTWEQQALVRGRFVAGDPVLKAEYEAIRTRILALPRDVARLKQEVREMREKMRESLANKASAVFDLKQSRGGIADIEFIVQFGVLAQTAHDHGLATYTDNVRLLEGLAAQGFMTAEEAVLLKKAYCRYRDYGHHQVLQGESALASEAEFAELRAQVDGLWQRFME